MSYPNSNSTLNDNIRTGLSTQIVVKIRNTMVGAIQSLQISQNREFYRQEEIGTDGIVEIFPRGATKIEVTVDRIVFDGLRLPEAFARGFINIQSQRIPFDIDIMDLSEFKTTVNLPQDDVARAILLKNNNAVVHSLKGCWFRSYAPTFSAEKFIVSERATIICEKIITTRNGLSAVNGGLRGVAYEKDSIERATDSRGIIGRYAKTGRGV
jgi:hypothetical protein